MLSAAVGTVRTIGGGGRQPAGAESHYRTHEDGRYADGRAGKVCANCHAQRGTQRRQVESLGIASRRQMRAAGQRCACDGAREALTAVVHHQLYI